MNDTPRTENVVSRFKDLESPGATFAFSLLSHILERELNKALADLERLKHYTGTEVQACPLCTYDDGILLEICGFHKLIEVAWFQRDRAEADLEAMREEIERGGIEGESQLIFIEALKNDREAMRKERDYARANLNSSMAAMKFNIDNMRKERDDFQKQLINSTDKDKR